VCDLTIELFGEPSRELVDASASLDVTTYRFFMAP
jgi:hypothetical protein